MLTVITPLIYWKVEVKLSPSKNIWFICFNESLSKMMKNAFYFISNARFILGISEILSLIFGHLEKTAWLERQG